MMRHPIVVLLPLVAALSCTDSTAPVPVTSPLGNRFRILGTAAGGDSAGRTAECQLDLVMELNSASQPRPIPLGVEFPFTMGGGVGRTVLESDGSGFGFFADVYWPTAVARVGTRDLVELVIGDTLQTESRFWREIALLRGVRDGEVGMGGGGATGTWTCAPFDIWENGYVDTLLVVQGTWRTERISP
jgi:hypothetical protein